MNPKAIATAVAVAVASLTLALHAHAQGSGSPTIDSVRARGQMVCGVSTGIAGFSLPDSQGVVRGFDADYCRIIAAAVLGDAGKVRFVPLTTVNRFTALQSGEIDVLIRETTWTASREANLGLEFAAVNYYDGTGFLVRKSLNVGSAKQLDGATVCVPPGSSTELAVADYFRTNKLRFTPVLIEGTAEIQAAFLSGRCDAYATDGSALAGFRSQQGLKAAELLLLPEVISKEPLGPMVRKGDDKWLDVVKWTHYAILTAEEYEITSGKVDAPSTAGNPDVRRLLGVEGDIGKALGLDNRWAYNAIKQVGNYGEIWERSLVPLGLPRGINGLWNKGGLQYPPPIR